METTNLTDKQIKVSNLLIGNTQTNYVSICKKGKLNFEAISLSIALNNRKATFADLLPLVTETLQPLYNARMQTNETWLTKRYTIYTKIAIKQRTQIIKAEKAVKETKVKVTK